MELNRPVNPLAIVILKLMYEQILILLFFKFIFLQKNAMFNFLYCFWVIYIYIIFFLLHRQCRLSFAIIVDINNISVLFVANWALLISLLFQRYNLQIIKCWEFLDLFNLKTPSFPQNCTCEQLTANWLELDEYRRISK